MKTFSDNQHCVKARTGALFDLATQDLTSLPPRHRCGLNHITHQLTFPSFSEPSPFSIALTTSNQKSYWIE